MESLDVGRLIVFIYVTYVIRVCIETVIPSALHRYRTVELVHKTVIYNLALMILIADACITKNVPQMKGYMVFKTLDQFYFLISLRISNIKHIAVLFSARLAVLLVELIVLYVFVQRFSRYYNWYSFKRLGTDKDLKDALKTRKQLVLVYKIILVFKFRNILTRRIVLTHKYMFYIVNIIEIAVAAIFFYSQKSENMLVRMIVIAFYIFSEILIITTISIHASSLFSHDQM